MHRHAARARSRLERGERRGATMNQALARNDETTESAAGIRPIPITTAPVPGPSRAPQAARPGRPNGIGRYLRPSVLAGMALKGVAHVAWHAFQALNRRLPY